MSWARSGAMLRPSAFHISTLAAASTESTACGGAPVRPMRSVPDRSTLDDAGLRERHFQIAACSSELVDGGLERLLATVVVVGVVLDRNEGLLRALKLLGGLLHRVDR